MLSGLILLCLLLAHQALPRQPFRPFKLPRFFVLHFLCIFLPPKMLPVERINGIACINNFMNDRKFIIISLCEVFLLDFFFPRQESLTDCHILLFPRYLISHFIQEILLCEVLALGPWSQLLSSGILSYFEFFS